MLDVKQSYEVRYFYFWIFNLCSIFTWMLPYLKNLPLFISFVSFLRPIHTALITVHHFLDIPLSDKRRFKMFSENKRWLLYRSMLQNFHCVESNSETNTCTSSCIFSPERATRAYCRLKFSSTSVRLSKLPRWLVLRVMQAEWLKTPINPCSFSKLALLFCTRSDTPRTRSRVLQAHTRVLINISTFA